MDLAFRFPYNILYKKYIQKGFAGASFILYDLKRVISKLDVYIRTPTPPTSNPTTILLWISQTLYNPQKATLQSAFIKTRISNYQGSSPTSMLTTIDQFAKGAMAIIHEVALLRTEVSLLCKANKGLSKKRRANKTRVQLRRLFTIQEAQDLLDQKAIGE